MGLRWTFLRLTIATGYAPESIKLSNDAREVEGKSAVQRPSLRAKGLSSGRLRQSFKLATYTLV